jgi:hypothetical protein
VKFFEAAKSIISSGIYGNNSNISFFKNRLITRSKTLIAGWEDKLTRPQIGESLLGIGNRIFKEMWFFP